jgi:DNA-binding beta-propeller fold protein YncE
MVLSSALPALAVAPQDTYTWQKNIGTSGCPPRGTSSGNTWGVAVVGNKVYVVNTDDRQVRIYSTNAASLLGFNGYGQGFSEPSGVAVDASGNIYVVDSSSSYIQKFDASGKFLLQFGTSGNGDGQFNRPYGIAVDASGNVYVADTYNDRIQKFNTSGTYISQFGGSGNGDGQFNRPHGIAVDTSGNIYVADTDNNRVQKFDTSGTYVAQFNSGNGEFNNPYSVTVGASGNIYVADTYNYRIVQLNSSGTYLSDFGSQGNGGGKFQFLVGVAVDANGNVYATDDSGNTGVDIQKFDASGNYVKDFTYQAPPEADPHSLCQAFGIARDKNGNVYVANNGRGTINKYSPSGTLLGTIGTQWDGNGQPLGGELMQPAGIAVDDAGNVYVADFYAGLQKFDASGNFVASVGSFGAYAQTPSFPLAVALDVSGNIYVSVTDGQQPSTTIQKFSSNGTYLSQFGSAGTGDGQIGPAAYGIAVDSSGNIYVLDSSNARVQKFDASGTYLSQFGSPGTGDGQFRLAVGFAVDAWGNIFVGDFNPSSQTGSEGRVQKFDANGNFLSQIGATGTGDGQFTTPAGITTDANGNVYVSDFGNNIVSVWKPAAVPSSDTSTDPNNSQQTPATGGSTAASVPSAPDSGLEKQVATWLSGVVAVVCASVVAAVVVRRLVRTRS